MSNPRMSTRRMPQKSLAKPTDVFSLKYSPAQRRLAQTWVTQEVMLKLLQVYKKKHWDPSKLTEAGSLQLPGSYVWLGAGLFFFLGGNRFLAGLGKLKGD